MHQAGRLTSRYWSLSLAGLIYINASEEDGADASNAMLAGDSP